MQSQHRTFRSEASILAAPVLAMLLGSCASITGRLEQDRQPQVVTVQNFEPHWFFNGNQMEAWVEFTFAVEQEGAPPIKVVSVQDWSDSFEGVPGGNTPKAQAHEGACPALRADGRKYRIEARFEKDLHRDIPDAHLILLTCSPMDR